MSVVRDRIEIAWVRCERAGGGSGGTFGIRIKGDEWKVITATFKSPKEYPQVTQLVLNEIGLVEDVLAEMLEDFIKRFMEGEVLSIPENYELEGRLRRMHNALESELD